MSPAWLPAFVVAAVVTLGATPLLRRLALACDLVDRPGERKIHAVPVPYLGGVAIAFGVLAGLALAPALGFRYAAVAFSAAVLCAVGLLDDHRQLGAAQRLAVETLAAVTALAVGFRLEMTGVAAIDAGLTLFWIVGLTNAVNLLDNMDGLGAGVAASMAAGAFLLASAQGLESAAVLAVAVGGASLGFLVYNARPATVFMGDAGSLFLGYLLAVVTLAATRPLAAPAGFVVPLLLAAVPIADTTTVVVARLRRGVSAAQGGKDHLSHRLVQRGLPAGAAVAVLSALSLAVGLLAALTGSRHLSLLAGVAIGGSLLGLLLAMALPAEVYDIAVVGLPGRLRLGAGVGIAGSVIAFSTGIAPIGADSALVRPSRAAASNDTRPSRPVATADAGVRGRSSRSVGPLALVGVAVADLGAALGVVLWQRRRRGESLPGDAVVDLRGEQPERAGRI